MSNGFNVDFGDQNFIIDFGEIQEAGGSIPSYTGDYEVTPTASGFTMPTQNKKMTDDVTVKAIPYYETSNPSGKTVYIAGQIEF